MYPIEPGSDVDDALNAVVAHELGERDVPPVEQFGLISPDSTGHMLAFGTRLWLRASGVRDPLQLVAPIYGMWYGKHSEEHDG